MAADASSSSLRVRFAPSPTGLLHIGGLRTALYNYLVAKKRGGAFVLRVEDTDRARYVEEAEADILSALDWAGLAYDEGPQVGGEHAPYYQSERSDTYQQYAEQLVDGGHAYYAFDTKEELEAMRERLATDDNPTPTYDAVTRMNMRNSLALSEEETRQLLEDGAEHVVRLKVPRRQTVRFDDLVRGPVAFDTGDLDDQVLLKSDGLPTYHLANVVDDHLMEITHVIRGEEWLPSTPKHKLLYDAFGWQMPKTAHLPLILSPDGGKLSKRSADALGLPVSVREYREAGYEPEALLNFLAFLGWNPGTEEEVFSLGELVEAFSLDRVGSSGVQFNVEKLQWYNKQHLSRLTPSELAARARPFVEEKGYAPSEEKLVEIAALMQDRIDRAKDLATQGAFFFEDPDEYEEKGVKKRWKDDAATLTHAYADRLEALGGFDKEAIETALRDLADEHGAGAGRVIHPTRLAVSGRSSGPGLFGMMVAVGKEACIRRLRRAADVLG